MMTTTAAFSIRPANWARDEVAIAKVRQEVFIDEQRVPDELEWEAIDAACRWFVAESYAGIIGIARLLPDGHFGRMAVRLAWRRRGIGSGLLNAAMQAALESGLNRVVLSAQVHAIPFYARAGFQVQGPEYLDAGIPHRTMIRELK